MPVTRSLQEQAIPVALPASLLLHAIAIALLFLLPRPTPLQQPPENSIEVEFVEEAPRPATPPQQPPPLPAKQASPPSVERAPAVPPPSPKPAEPPSPPAMIQAGKILSSLALADPRSRQAMKTLPLLAPNERMEQLCNIEALAQLRAWNHDLEPDLTIAYAMAETKMSDASVTADGAVFRSRKQWFALKYRCTLAAGLAKVSAFEFQAGAAIPRSEWGRLNLPTGDKPQD